jgi:hypothetical protein
MTIEKKWSETILFYEGIASNELEFEPLLSLIHQINKTEYSKIIFPSTSHHILCLSTAETYQARLSIPMITVAYIGNNMFELQYWQKPLRTNNVETIKVNVSETWLLLQDLLLRLRDETKSK